MKQKITALLLALWLLVQLIPAVSADESHEILLDVNDPGCGSLTVSQDQAREGETVIVTISVEPGCILESFLPTCGSGEQAEGRFLRTEDGTAAFEIRMPDDTLYIHAVFTRECGYGITLELGSQERYGTAAIDSAEGFPGDPITLTLTPARGCRLDSVQVLREDGSILPLTSIGGGNHVFAVPEGDVRIHVVFCPCAQALRSPHRTFLRWTRACPK